MDWSLSQEVKNCLPHIELKKEHALEDIKSHKNQKFSWTGKIASHILQNNWRVKDMDAGKVSASLFAVSEGIFALALVKKMHRNFANISHFRIFFICAAIQVAIILVTKIVYNLLFEIKKEIIVTNLTL